VQGHKDYIVFTSYVQYRFACDLHYYVKTNLLLKYIVSGLGVLKLLLGTLLFIRYITDSFIKKVTFSQCHISYPFICLY